MEKQAKCNTQLINKIVDEYKLNKYTKFLTTVNLMFQKYKNHEKVICELMKRDSMTDYEEGKTLYKYFALMSLLKQMILDKKVDIDYVEKYMDDVYKDSSVADLRNEIRGDFGTSTVHEYFKSKSKMD